MSNIVNFSDYIDNYKIIIDGEPTTPLEKLIEQRSKAIAAKENVETIKRLDNEVAELGGWRLRDSIWKELENAK